MKPKSPRSPWERAPARRTAKRSPWRKRNPINDRDKVAWLPPGQNRRVQGVVIRGGAFIGQSDEGIPRGYLVTYLETLEQGSSSSSRATRRSESTRPAPSAAPSSTSAIKSSHGTPQRPGYETPEGPSLQPHGLSTPLTPRAGTSPTPRPRRNRRRLGAHRGPASGIRGASRLERAPRLDAAPQPPRIPNPNHPGSRITPDTRSPWRPQVTTPAVPTPPEDRVEPCDSEPYLAIRTGRTLDLGQWLGEAVDPGPGGAAQKAERWLAANGLRILERELPVA